MSNLTNILAAAKQAANNPKVPVSTTAQVQQAKQAAKSPKKTKKL